MDFAIAAAYAGAATIALAYVFPRYKLEWIRLDEMVLVSNMFGAGLLGSVYFIGPLILTGIVAAHYLGGLDWLTSAAAGIVGIYVSRCLMRMMSPKDGVPIPDATITTKA
jgi:hypothetical protein